MRKLLVFLFAFLWLLPAFSQDVVFHGFSDSVKNAQWSIEDNPADTIGNNWEFEDLLEESNPVAYCRTDTAETVNFRLVSPSFNLMGSTTTGSVEFYTLVLPVGVFDGEMAYDTTVLGQYSVSVIVDGVESVVIQHALSGIGDGWVPIRILLSDLIEDGIIDTLHSNSLQVAITFEEAFGGNNHSTFFLVDDFTYRKRDNSFVIRFMAGAGTGSMTDMMVRAGDTIMVPGCGFRAPADSSFLLWYAFDSSDSTYVLYLGDAIVAESDMIWVAFYSSNYSIRLHANSADNDSLDIPAQQYMGHLLEDNPFSNGTAVFRGWNSERDGSGTAYAAGDTLDLLLDEDDNIISTVMNFYAQWDITVSFDANGGTGTMPAATMRNFADYQIPDASFTMVHREFKGWNTAPDGSGQNYVVGATARFHTPVTLYAQWLDAPQLTVYFDANDGDGNMNDTTYYVGDAFLAPSCAFSYQWHTFVEWNTMRDGSGDSYAPGDPTSFDVNTTLYAIWSDDAITTVKFDGNGGYSSVVEDTIISEGVPFTFPDCLFEYVGVRFIGWSLAPNETETIYAPGTSAMLDSGDVWIYAQWEDLENPVSYYFYATDGDGEMPTLSVELGETFVIPSCRFTYSHYTFIGWNTEYDGSGDAYTPGQMITADEDLDLYAQWQWAGIVRIGFHDNAYNYNSNEDPQGYMAPVTANVNDGYVVPDCGYTLDGYDFVGWCTDEYGDADTILAGSVMYTQYDPRGDLITDSLTLYAIWSEQVRVIIHFDADNPMASGEMADTIVMQGDLYNLPDCGFTLDGYTFIGWSPDPYDEDIYPYAVGDIFSYPFDDDGEYIIGDYTLYALWAKVYSLDLLFVANGGEGEMLDTTILRGYSYEIPPCPFSNDGYVFTGWNDMPDGSGEYNYQPGDYFDYPVYDDEPYEGNFFLYAQWRPVVTITLYLNGNSLDAVGQMDPVQVCDTVPFTLPRNQYTRDGFIFAGWNTDPNGEGISYADGAAFSIPQENGRSIAEDVFLYAIWTEMSAYRISYDANGGTGYKDDTIVRTGDVYVIAGVATFTREGYTFAGWNTEADGSGTSYAAGEQVVISARLVLYAQWEEIVIPVYTISFDANGGTGTMASQEAEEGSTFVLPECAFTREGFDFIGWTINNGSASEVYAPGQEIVVTSDMVISAYWSTPKPPTEGIDNAVMATVRVYPNPVVGMARVSGVSVERLEVLDLNGRRLLSAEGSSIDMQGLVDGVYMLRIYAAEGTAVRRIVKK